MMLKPDHEYTWDHWFDVGLFVTFFQLGDYQDFMIDLFFYLLRLKR